MTRHALLLALPLLALSCIPIKTPEPGIPAKRGGSAAPSGPGQPPATTGCPPLPAWNTDTCGGQNPTGCTMAMQSPLAITCTTGKIAVATIYNKAGVTVGSLTCSTATMTWQFLVQTQTYPQSNFEGIFGTSPMVACVNP